MKSLIGAFGAAVVALAVVLPQMAMGVEISKVREGKLAAFSFTYELWSGWRGNFAAVLI